MLTVTGLIVVGVGCFVLGTFFGYKVKAWLVERAKAVVDKISG